MNKLISIVIPLYNEEETLPITYSRLIRVLKDIKYDYEIMFVNDGSKDKSIKIIKELRQKDPCISYLDLSRNFGKEIAMAAGFDYVAGDAVIIMDADLQDPPEMIPEMIKYWEEGFDDVYAKRKNRNGETWLKKETSHYFYKILKKISRIEIQEDTGDFRLLSRRAVEAIREFREHHRYTKGFFSWIGFNKKEILFEREARIAGKSKWNYIKLTELAIEGITSFSSIPLRICTLAGFIAVAIGFIYVTYIIIKKLVFGDPVAGYASLVSLFLFFGSIQLISLGIIGEYLGRIFDETKNRPLYFINEYNDKKTMSER
ncbi:glycosyltransferase family 2 protein [Petroclostridium sp. X23]|uniref:glycosyltransferase family 2 protein n=1 Tax=Petroclostridium sp. X23 TaxID=3045146 RepID=UPI0024ADAEAD|nr:glycosyltransferase family 2 protein [Petroclostridium sp. X23]WHH58615.1 glycosyltransferase family 2 protein [Petroclostridium sp. X23]